MLYCASIYPTTEEKTCLTREYAWGWTGVVTRGGAYSLGYSLNNK